MTRTADTATVTISRRAVLLVREIAAAEGCTPRQYLEALLHYGGSCHKRQGSWEAWQPFDLQMYLSADCLADRWF
jgi:hypothetical protein